VESVVRISRQWIVFALASLLVCIAEPASTNGIEPKRAVSRSEGVAAEPLSIEIKLSDRKLSGDGAVILQDVFDVVLVNNSDRPFEIWNPDSPQGWSQLSFQLTDLATGRQQVIPRRPVAGLKRKVFPSRPQEDGGDRMTIGPDGEYDFEVLLSDCERSDRDWLGVPKTTYQQRFLFQARFESPPIPHSADKLLWAGKIESSKQTVRVADWQPQSPHYYLKHDLPGKALEVLKSDPSWISKPGNEDLETPLHVAAKEHGYPDVVKWLVDNAADVNAVASNHETPLHKARNPAVIELILAKHPDLTIRDSAADETVLLRAARQWNAAGPEERGKWQTIIDLYKKAGAEYDLGAAIELDDLARVKVLLSQSPHLAHKPEWRAPLRMAASLGRLEICRYLIERFHVDVNGLNRGAGFPIIKDALDDPKIVRLLIASGADVGTRIAVRGDRDGMSVVGENATLLHYAAEDGVPGSIQLLIDNGVDIFATTNSPFVDFGGKPDLTALDVAAVFGNAENAAAILHHPKFQLADPKRRKELVDRCLACRRWKPQFGPPVQRWKLLETLLNCGADPNARVDGMTAIQRAAQEIWPSGNEVGANQAAIADECRKEIDVLRKHGGELDLVSAVGTGNEAEVARLLKQNPRSANSRRPDGYPALHWAVAMNYEPIVKQLLNAGCDVDLRNQWPDNGQTGATALHVAAFWGRLSIAKLLLAHGANVDAISTPNRWTPLYDAVHSRRVEIARLLLQSGANPDATDKDGATPLDYCEQTGHRKTIAIRALFREYARGAAGTRHR
jgi:ankyrin repeat protein